MSQVGSRFHLPGHHQREQQQHHQQQHHQQQQRRGGRQQQQQQQHQHSNINNNSSSNINNSTKEKPQHLNNFRNIKTKTPQCPQMRIAINLLPTLTASVDISPY